MEDREVGSESEKVKTVPLRVGAHTSIGGGLERALLRGKEAGCDVVQVFTRSNQQWKAKAISEGDVERWEQARGETGIAPAMAHGSYLVNLAAPDPAIRDRSYGALSHELERCARLGIPDLVIHPGAHLGDGEEVGIRRIAAALDRAFDEAPACPTRVLLENTAGQGTTIGHKFEHLRDLLAASRHPERLGVCIDTCHTLAAGYDIRTADAWEATFDELGRVVGIEQVRAFHVNDSKVALGGRVDRHEHLGCGYAGLEAFRCLVNDARFVGLPMVLETPKLAGEADPLNLAVLRALCGRTRVGPKPRRLAGELADLAARPQKRRAPRG